LENSSWWSDFLGQREQLTLRAAAEKFGVSVNGLSTALRRVGLGAAEGEAPRRRGRKPNAAAAASSTDVAPVPAAPRKARRKGRTGPDPRSAEAQSWWPEFLALKDSRSLASLARRFGVAEITLGRAIKRTGIERAPAATGRRGAAGRRAAATESPAPAPRAAVATAPASTRGKGRFATGREAWLVRVAIQDDASTSRFVVIGKDLADAAGQALSVAEKRLGARGWAIDGIELVGPAVS
jgi:lambda repressor-like predicted transcriptional regulator